MDHNTVTVLSASLGLIWFGAIFLGVVLYAFWPSNKRTFNEAASIPFRED